MASAAPQDDEVPTTCYKLNGKVADGAFRCNNATTGHSSCCAAGGVCYSNGVCQQPNGDVQDYLRVACTDKTWRSASCLNQCTLYAPDSSAGIRFCHGAITSTNEYCCDRGGTGVGSFACCDKPAEIFRINPVATLIGQIPMDAVTSTKSTTSSTSSTSSTSTSSTRPSITVSSFPQVTPVQTESSNTSVIVGAAVGVPVGLIALGLIGWLFWRRRRNQRAGGTNEVPTPAADVIEAKYQPVMHTKYYSPPPPNGTHELDTAEEVPREIHEMGPGESRYNR